MKLFFKKKIILSAITYSGFSISTSLISFLLTPYLARNLSQEVFGIISIFTIWSSALGVLIGLGTENTISVIYFDKDKIKTNTYISSCIFLMILVSFVLLLLILIFLDEIEKKTLLREGWVIVGLAVSIMQFIITIRIALWQAQKKSFYIGVMQLFIAILGGISTIIFINNFNMNGSGRILGIFISNFMGMIFSILIFWKIDNIKFEINLKYIKEAIIFGAPIIPHIAGGMLLIAADRIIIANQMGPVEVGVYSIALQISALMSILTSSFNQAYIPWLFERLKKEDDKIKKQIVKYTYLYFLLLIVVSITISIFFTKIYLKLVGKGYEAVLEIAPYLLSACVFTGMYLMVTNYIFFKRRSGILALNTGIVALVNIGLTIILVKNNGLIGAAQALMISQLLLFISTWVISNQIYPMPWINFKDIKKS